jgi:hypothetical protein
MDQKKKDVLFSSMPFLCFKNFGYKIILKCVLIIFNQDEGKDKII